MINGEKKDILVEFFFSISRDGHMKLKKRIWILSFCLLAFIAYFFIFSNDDLNLRNITANIPFNPKWEVAAPAPEEQAKIDIILEQPFIYLDEGGQSYVFSSADQKYILKLFKFKRFRPNFFVDLLPDVYPFKSYKSRHTKKRENKLIAAFNGYKIAYDLHKAESALIYVQLNPSNQSKIVTLIDKQNNERKINLEKVSFVLQEKGEMLGTDLTKILDQGNILKAKQRIDQVLALYLSEYRKGFYDLDRGVMHNIGTIGDRLFHLDVGKLVLDNRIQQREFYQEDLIEISTKLRNWIDKRYPQYAQELTTYLENGLSHNIEKKFKFPLKYDN